jgi:hypothetical protein
MSAGSDGTCPGQHRIRETTGSSVLTWDSNLFRRVLWSMQVWHVASKEIVSVFSWIHATKECGFGEHGHPIPIIEFFSRQSPRSEMCLGVSSNANGLDVEQCKPELVDANIIFQTQRYLHDTFEPTRRIPNNVPLRPPKPLYRRKRSAPATPRTNISI